MSKSTDHQLLIPGENGWELWSRHGSEPYSLESSFGTTRTDEVDPIPAGDLIMMFPVKSFTAVPMRVNSDDESLFPDLATLHAERLGIRPDPMAGQLSDIFVVDKQAENSALLAVFLRTPGDGEMPKRSPKGFDISPRTYPMAENSLTIWKEFGRWVFALNHQGKLVFCQATAIDSTAPDDTLIREIKLSLVQLALQGLPHKPSQIVVWSESNSVDIPLLEQSFGLPATSSHRPSPELPKPLSILLPADVRAARRAALKRRNLLTAAAAAALVYLSLIGWLGYGLWKTHAEAKRLAAEAAAAAPEGEAYTLHVTKWDELADAIDLNHAPVDILQRIASCIPRNSGLRLRIADISATEIKLQGEAPKLDAVNGFNLNLNKNVGLSRYVWQTPEPNQSTRGWEFVYTGEAIQANTQP